LVRIESKEYKINGTFRHDSYNCASTSGVPF
jgi:hypothetical protein